MFLDHGEILTPTETSQRKTFKNNNCHRLTFHNHISVKYLLFLGFMKSSFTLPSKNQIVNENNNISIFNMLKLVLVT